MKKPIDFTKQKKSIKDKYDKMKDKIIEVYQGDDSRFVIVTQTERRVGLGYPPCELIHSDLEETLHNLEVIHGK